MHHASVPEQTLGLGLGLLVEDEHTKVSYNSYLPVIGVHEMQCTPITGR